MNMQTRIPAVEIHQPDFRERAHEALAIHNCAAISAAPWNR